MKRFLAIAIMLTIFVMGCTPPSPKPLIPKLPHKPHLQEKVARIEVLDFYTKWCAPCRAAAPTIDVLISQGHKISKINAEDEPELAAKHKVTSYPTFIVLKRGKEIYRTHNVQELRRYLNKRLWHHTRPERDHDDE